MVTRQSQAGPAFGVADDFSERARAFDTLLDGRRIREELTGGTSTTAETGAAANPERAAVPARQPVERPPAGGAGGSSSACSGAGC